MVNKDCYGPPLARTEGSWRSLLLGLSQGRSHNGKLKAEAIPLSAAKKGLISNGGLHFSLLADSGEALRDRYTAVS